MSGAIRGSSFPARILFPLTSLFASVPNTVAHHLYCFSYCFHFLDSSVPNYAFDDVSCLLHRPLFLWILFSFTLFVEKTQTREKGFASLKSSSLFLLPYCFISSIFFSSSLNLSIRTTVPFFLFIVLTPVNLARMLRFRALLRWNSFS